MIVIINLENQNKIECMMRDQSTESRRDDESSSGENSEDQCNESSQLQQEVTTTSVKSSFISKKGQRNCRGECVTRARKGNEMNSSEFPRNV